MDSPSSARLPKPTLLSLSIAAALCSPSAASAQISPNRNTPAATLEPVVVTAQAEEGTAEQGYRVENTKGVGPWGERSLQDTPYSITVVPEALIENAVAKDMNQIFKMTPTAQENFSTSSNATGGYRVTLRGFSIASPVINGISSASGVAGTPSVYELERVEILNGATGFLYGGGRVGGAVNYVTKKSTQEDLRAVALGTYGGESHFGHVDLGGQFNQAKTFGYRLNAVYQNGETTRKENRKQKALSLSLDWRPTNAFLTELRYSYKDTTAPGPTIPSGYYAGVKKNQSFTPKWLVQEFTSNKIENNTRWKINDVFALRSSLMLEHLDRIGGDARMRMQDDRVLPSSFFGNYAPQQTKKTGGAIFLDSTFDTFGIAHQLTTGYSFSTDRATRHQDSSASYRIPRIITREEFRNWARPDTWNTRVGQGPKYVGSRAQYRNVLIGDDMIINDQWSLMVGFNHARGISYGYRVDGSASSKYDESAWTPTISLSYKPIDSLTTYATYIESLENGTTVSATYLNEGEVLPPYISKQYEVGAKFTFSERLSINTSLFRLEKANRYETPTLPKPTYTQDGLQVHQGIELSIVGKLTENLSVMAGGTLMDLSIEKARDASTEGKKPTFASQRLAKLYVDYRVPGAPGLYVSGGAYYTSKKYQDALNTIIMPAYTVYDLGVRYETKVASYPTTLNLSIQNLTDKVYWMNAMGDPRTVAFTVKTRF